MERNIVCCCPLVIKREREFKVREQLLFKEWKEERLNQKVLDQVWYLPSSLRREIKRKEIESTIFFFNLLVLFLLNYLHVLTLSLF